MRNITLDIITIISLLGSFFLFYNCIDFLAEKDYVAGFIIAALGVFVLRVSAEFARYNTFSQASKHREDK